MKVKHRRYKYNSSYFINCWYTPFKSINGYKKLNKFRVKLAENFLHWIKNEPQTDMNGNEIKEQIVYENTDGVELNE